MQQNYRIQPYLEIPLNVQAPKVRREFREGLSLRMFV